MLVYKSVMDNKKAIREFNYLVATKANGQKVRGKVKSFNLASTRNKIGQIVLDTKSIFKYIIPSDYAKVELINKVNGKYQSKIVIGV